jgi:3-polyprenyl-4-hydroxybenzoate decarboxylase
MIFAVDCIDRAVAATIKVDATPATMASVRLTWPDSCLRRPRFDVLRETCRLVMMQRANYFLAIEINNLIFIMDSIDREMLELMVGIN